MWEQHKMEHPISESLYQYCQEASSTCDGLWQEKPTVKAAAMDVNAWMQKICGQWPYQCQHFDNTISYEAKEDQAKLPSYTLSILVIVLIYSIV